MKTLEITFVTDQMASFLLCMLAAAVLLTANVCISAKGTTKQYLLLQRFIVIYTVAEVCLELSSSVGHMLQAWQIN